MNMLFGNSSLHPDVALVDLAFPPGAAARFGGPRFGIDGLRRLTGYLRRRGSEAVAVSWHMLGVANQAFDAMQSTIARQKMAAYPPDILVELPRDLCGMHEFHRAAEIIEHGYAAAARCIPAVSTAPGD